MSAVPLPAHNTHSTTHRLAGCNTGEVQEFFRT